MFLIEIEGERSRRGKRREEEEREGRRMGPTDTHRKEIWHQKTWANRQLNLKDTDMNFISLSLALKPGIPMLQFISSKFYNYFYVAHEMID